MDVPVTTTSSGVSAAVWAKAGAASKASSAVPELKVREKIMVSPVQRFQIETA
jgi:hypothetical protein